MKFNTSFIISLVLLGVGILYSQPFIWIPASVFVASIIDLFARNWVTSDKIGRAQTASSLLRGILALVGIYATIGQAVLIGLAIWWFA